MYYELKLKVNKANEKGDEKEVTEIYVTDDEIFASVELKGNELYNGECDVFAINRSKIREIVGEKKEDEFFYKARLEETFVLEDGGESIKSYQILISAKDVNDAAYKLKEYLKQGYSEMVVSSLQKTKILDII